MNMRGKPVEARICMKVPTVITVCCTGTVDPRGVGAKCGVGVFSEKDPKPRVIPHYVGVGVPLEETRILWQR